MKTVLKSADQLEDVKTLTQYFGTAQEVLDLYTHCSCCGSQLSFKHFTDFSLAMTQEVAKCPECGTKAHEQTYKLQ